MAALFKEAGLIERYGSGIKRILESFARYDLNPPLFEEVQEGFRVTVTKTTQKTTQKIATREQVLELLQINPNMTRSELALQLSKSENTIKEHLAKLKVEGRLKRIGSDRSGYWMVVSQEGMPGENGKRRREKGEGRRETGDRRRETGGRRLEMGK